MEGQLSKNDDLAFLRLFKEYKHSEQKISFLYSDEKSKELKRLREEFDLDSIAGSGPELKRITRLRNWVYQSLKSDSRDFYNVKKDEKTPWNTFYIFDVFNHKPFLVDCGTSALVMTEVMLAMGWKARWIQCLPFDLRYNESHCISHVWSNDYNKWIIVDAAQDLFYFNKEAIPFGIPDLRDAIIGNERVLIYSNNQKATGREWLKNYWIKNIFRFHCLTKSCFSMFDQDSIDHIYLNPKGYDITNKVIDKEGKTETHIHIQDDEAFWEVNDQ